MKLYSVGRSPFAARVRCVLYHKALDVPCVPPPKGGLKGDDYLAVNPLGRLPTLVLDDGEAIPESEVIVDYLEQAYPERPVTPQESRRRARARLVARIAELYVLGPLFELFPQLDPARGDPAVVDSAFTRMMAGAAHLEHFISGQPFAVGDALTVADCMAVPAWFWVREIHARFGRTPDMTPLPKTARYLESALADPLLGKVWREMADDLAALRASRG